MALSYTITISYTHANGARRGRREWVWLWEVAPGVRYRICQSGAELPDPARGCFGNCELAETVPVLRCGRGARATNRAGRTQCAFDDDVAAAHGSTGAFPGISRAELSRDRQGRPQLWPRHKRGAAALPGCRRTQAAAPVLWREQRSSQVNPFCRDGGGPPWNTSDQILQSLRQTAGEWTARSRCRRLLR